MRCRCRPRRCHLAVGGGVPLHIFLRPAAAPLPSGWRRSSTPSAVHPTARQRQPHGTPSARQKQPLLKQKTHPNFLTTLSLLLSNSTTVEFSKNLVGILGEFDKKRVTGKQGVNFGLILDYFWPDFGNEFSKTGGRKRGPKMPYRGSENMTTCIIPKWPLGRELLWGVRNNTFWMVP